jgi:hypothetical protein
MTALIVTRANDVMDLAALLRNFATAEPSSSAIEYKRRPGGDPLALAGSHFAEFGAELPPLWCGSLVSSVAQRGSAAKPGAPPRFWRGRPSLFRELLPMVAVATQTIPLLPQFVSIRLHLGEKLAQG